jgi:hypothetical protein
MPSIHLLPDSVRQNIASQIAQRLPVEAFRAAPGAAAGPSLAESFPIEMLSLGKLRDGAEINEAAHYIGRWHHQIHAPGGEPRFARSVEVEPSVSYRIGEVVTGPLSQKLSHVIAWIDEHLGDVDGTASLLLIPDYLTTCIRIHGPTVEKIVVVERPERLSALELDVAFDAHAFLELLRNETPSAGIPPSPAGA